MDKPFNVILKDEKRQLFEEYASKKGWSLGKFLRIAAYAVMLQESKNYSLSDALAAAIQADRRS